MELNHDPVGDVSMLQHLVQLEIERERLSGLTRAQGMQLFGMEARNSIAQMLRMGRDPDHISAQYVIRGSGAEAREILEHAVHFEEHKEDEAPDERVLSILHDLLERADEGDVSRAHKDATLIQKLKQRIESGESLRAFDLDLTEDELQQLLKAVEPKFRTVVTLMMENNRRLTALLDQHSKFPALLNAVAFARKFDETPEKNGTFVFFDLNGFKACNSKYSYTFVDALVLKPLTEALKKELPKNALAGLKGGDEFMAYVPDTADVKTVMQQLASIMQRTLQNITPQMILNHQKLLNRSDMSLEEAGEIRDHLASLHAKMSGTHKTDRSFEEMEAATVMTLKKADTEEYKAALRFPAIVVEDAEKEDAVFSAINLVSAPVILRIGDMTKKQNVLLTVPHIRDVA